MTGKPKAAKTLSLEKVLDLNEATNLHAKLLALRGADLSIDASNVEKVGALCVQVLMSAAKSWEEDNNALVFTRMSDPLITSMQLIGIKYDHLLAKESNS